MKIRMLVGSITAAVLALAVAGPAATPASSTGQVFAERSAWGPDYPPAGN